MDDVEVVDKTFLAAMELYQHEDGVHAIIRLAGSEESQEVLVPQHMAVMLPQAIAMLQQDAAAAPE